MLTRYEVMDDIIKGLEEGLRATVIMPRQQAINSMGIMLHRVIEYFKNERELCTPPLVLTDEDMDFFNKNLTDEQKLAIAAITGHEDDIEDEQEGLV